MANAPLTAPQNQFRQMAPGDAVATVGSTQVTLAQVDEKAMQQPATSFGNVKLSELGRLAFFAGLLAFLLRTASTVNWHL